MRFFREARGESPPESTLLDLSPITYEYSADLANSIKRYENVGYINSGFLTS